MSKENGPVIDVELGIRLTIRDGTFVFLSLEESSGLEEQLRHFIKKVETDKTIKKKSKKVKK